MKLLQDQRRETGTLCLPGVETPLCGVQNAGATGGTGGVGDGDAGGAETLRDGLAGQPLAHARTRALSLPFSSSLSLPERECALSCGSAGLEMSVELVVWEQIAFIRNAR